MSVRVFLEETNIWFRRLSREIYPHQSRWASPNPLGAQMAQNSRARASSLSSWAGMSRHLLPLSIELLVLRPSDSGTWTRNFWLPDLWPWAGSCTSGSLFLRSMASAWTTTLSFPGLQLTDGRSRDFSASRATWVSSYNKSLICIYVSYRLCFSGEPWLTWYPILKLVFLECLHYGHVYP